MPQPHSIRFHLAAVFLVFFLLVVVLGLFSIWRGETNAREKPNDLCVGFSRDGFHWSRQDRTAFVPVSERVGDWNWGNIQSAGGCCVIAGDTLHF